MPDRNDLLSDIENDSLGAFINGGFGAALIEADDAQDMSREELSDLAKARGIDIDDYDWEDDD